MGSPFETEVVELHGHPVTYHLMGQGPAVLLVHGITSSSRTWHSVMPALADLFRAHVLARNSQIEGELADPTSSRSEQRLARWLLLLASFDEHHAMRHPLPVISRNLLAEMIGTSRSTVNVLMNRFRKRGFLERHRERDGGLQVHGSMLSVVLDDWPVTTPRDRL